MTINVELNKKYRNRQGKIVTATKRLGGSSVVVLDNNDHVFAHTGRRMPSRLPMYDDPIDLRCEATCPFTVGDRVVDVSMFMQKEAGKVIAVRDGEFPAIKVWWDVDEQSFSGDAVENHHWWTASDFILEPEKKKEVVPTSPIKKTVITTDKIEIVAGVFGKFNVCPNEQTILLGLSDPEYTIFESFTVEELRESAKMFIELAEVLEKINE